MGDDMKVDYELFSIFESLKSKCNIKLEMPVIIAVGNSDSGKSSVLERLVGRDFLPHSDGSKDERVTMRPLILQLIPSAEEYGIFKHTIKKFINFKEIGQEIKKETKRLAGSEEGISEVPIKLKIYSPNVLNITLIDLPAVITNPIGDIPINIEEVSSTFIKKFLKEKKNCIILSITAANHCLLNCNGLKIAREVDPEGVRTIGILTKLDLMEKGRESDAAEILKNKKFPLRRGYIGLINRSLADFKEGKSMKDAEAFEKQYFMSHPAYRVIAGKCGIQQLRNAIHQQLTNYVINTLKHLEQTTLQNEFSNLRKRAENHLRFKPNASLMAEIIQKFQTDFEENIGFIQTSINESLSVEIQDKRLHEEDLRRKISIAQKSIDASGTDVTTRVTKFIIKDEIAKLKLLSLSSFDATYQQLFDVLQSCTDETKQYPLLHAELQTIVQIFLDERKLICQEKIDTLIDLELTCINTNNHKDIIRSQFIKEGYLNCQKNNEEYEKYWFVLTAYNASWFSNEEKRDKKYELILHDVIFKNIGNDEFIFINPQNKNIHQDFKELKIAVENKSEVYSWKLSFWRAGLYAEEATSQVDEDGAGKNSQSIDPFIIQDIMKTVYVYLEKVNDRICDLVSKIIFHTLVRETKEFVNNGLISNLHAKGDETWLMSEKKRHASSPSEPEQAKRKKLTLTSSSSQTEAINEELIHQRALNVGNSS